MTARGRRVAPRAHAAVTIVLALVLALAASIGGTALADRGGRVHLSGAEPHTLTLPGRIGAPDDVLQMITVTSPRWSSTVGTLKAWQRPAGGRWTKVHGPLPVVLGYSGWVIASRRVQSTGTTPAGRFGLPSAFGALGDPGTSLRYRQVDASDWWPYEPHDPATYNIYQEHKDSRSRWRPDYSEHLASYPTQYALAVVIGFNLPHGVHYDPQRNQRVASQPADPGVGGGIFLHVRGSGLTAGCVAATQEHIRWLLQWLAPSRHPQIVMGPYDYVLTL